MDKQTRLLNLGAEIVGGDLILRQKTVGRWRHGDFFVTDEGLELLEADAAVEDAVVVSETSRAKPAKAPKPAKPAKAEAAAGEAHPEGDLGLDVGLDG